MKLFVGLGNPGAKYEANRHNIGFMIVDEIASAHGFTSWRKRFQSQASEGVLNIEKQSAIKCLLLKPMTYMNESGRAVQEAIRFYKIALEDVIVFHDELDLKPGKLKVKSGGGHAGHNGLRSISAHIGNDYMRVRLGIGHPGRKDLVHSYVLRDFAKADQTWLDPLIKEVAKAAPCLAYEDSPNFMNKVALGLNPNKQSVSSSKVNVNADIKQGEKLGKEIKPQATQAEQNQASKNALVEGLMKWRIRDKKQG